MRPKLIAPCGMNCNICYAYLRDKNKCPGCRYVNRACQISMRQCIIRTCPILRKNKYKFCFKCHKFPCRRLRQLDKRYRTKYRMSMINNLKYIQKKGLVRFVVYREKRWQCLGGEGIICVHNRKRYKIRK